MIPRVPEPGAGQEQDALGLMLKEHGIEVDETTDPERAALLSRGTLQ